MIVFNHSETFLTYTPNLYYWRQYTRVAILYRFHWINLYVKRYFWHHIFVIANQSLQQQIIKLNSI